MVTCPPALLLILFDACTANDAEARRTRRGLTGNTPISNGPARPSTQRRNHARSVVPARLGKQLADGVLLGGQELDPGAAVTGTNKTAIKQAAHGVGVVYEQARKPGMPLSILANIAREAPLGSLFAAFLLGLAFARLGDGSWYPGELAKKGFAMALADGSVLPPLRRDHHNWYFINLLRRHRTGFVLHACCFDPTLEMCFEFGSLSFLSTLSDSDLHGVTQVKSQVRC